LASCNIAGTFTDDDLLLGSKPYNRRLFVNGYIREQNLNGILVDGGSAINIKAKSTMHDLAIMAEELLMSQVKSGRLINVLHLPRNWHQD